MTSRWLNPSEEAAWRGFRRMFTLLEATLARELTEDSDLSMADYTVLSNLVEVDDRKWRVTALADHIKWSQSRLSHQLRRMEERGLVRRRPSSEDGRGAIVMLTKPGLEAIAAATPGHLAAVRKNMVDLLSPDEIEMLGRVSTKVVSHLTSEKQ